jgi:hypothetical protein
MSPAAKRRRSRSFPQNAEDPLAGVMWAPDGTLVAGDAQGYVRIDSHNRNVRSA